MQILKQVQETQVQLLEGRTEREAAQPAERPAGLPPSGWTTPGKVPLYGAWVMWHTGDQVFEEDGAPPTRVLPLKNVDRLDVGQETRKRFDKYLYVMKAVDSIVAASNGISDARLKEPNLTMAELTMWWGCAWEDVKGVWNSTHEHTRKYARLAWISWTRPLKGARKK